MANVTLIQLGEHAEWKPDEIVTVKVISVEAESGSYLCETLETYPPDLKQRHADEKQALGEQLDAAHAELRRRDQEAVAQGLTEVVQQLT